MEWVISVFSKIDILVHIADIYPNRPLVGHPTEVYRRIMSVVLLGPCSDTKDAESWLWSHNPYFVFYGSGAGARLDSVRGIEGSSDRLGT
jgi:NAD(P)-dependent dehydrogenase (short-subunit alcohol dehydrogenase family)